MKQTFIDTRLGRIAVYTRMGRSGKPPLVFLHGVYFDHHLWDRVADKLEAETIVSIDMPWHGESSEVHTDRWTLDDCADMLIEILEKMVLTQVVAIGHSWGSMTILRAAVKSPEYFLSAGLCNMPFRSATAMQKLTFHMQHFALHFRTFYAKQAGKALFGKASLKNDSTLPDELQRPMARLTTQQIRRTDGSVILRADDATEKIAALKVPALALKGREDYVPAPQGMETTIIPGGHVSPLEQPGEVAQFVHRVISLAQPAAD